MDCFFAGELNNAARYFSTFANVSVDDMTQVNGTLGEDEDCTWRPWKYEKRMENVQKVENFKKTITHLAKSTQRTKILNYMKSIGSRQESTPIIGKLVDKVFADGLYNGNNAWQHFHLVLLNEAKHRSTPLPNCNKLSDLPIDCVLKKFILAIKHKVGAGRLYKKVCKWFRGGMKGKFEFRFTGKETRKLCYNFMYLVDSLTKPNETPLEMIKSIAFAVVGTELREAVSLFSRVEISQEEIHELKDRCNKYFNGYALFIWEITPTIWTIGYCVSYHTQQLYDKFRLGLGLNTMQGREAKHISISNFAKHSTLANRWDMVFRHEFVSCVWLREHDPMSIHYKHVCVKCVPEHISKQEFCFCRYMKDRQAEKCKFCSHPLFTQVQTSVENGEHCNETRQILGVLGSRMILYIFKAVEQCVFIRLPFESEIFSENLCLSTTKMVFFLA